LFPQEKEKKSYEPLNEIRQANQDSGTGLGPSIPILTVIH